MNNPSRFNGFTTPRVGCAASLVFWVALMGFIVTHSDPQSGVGIMFSPFYAGWFGVSVALVAFGVRHARVGEMDTVHAFYSLMSVPAITLGLLGVYMICNFMAVEIYRQLHPVIVR